MDNIPQSLEIFFENKLREYRSRRKAIESTYITGRETAKAVEVSHRVAKLIAQTGKPHTIGEELNLPAAKEMVGVMVGEKAAKQLDVISLSNAVLTIWLKMYLCS